MTRDREPISKEEYDELLNAYAEDFRDRFIDEIEYKRRLARIGMNASDIDDEVRKHRPR